MNRAIVLVGVEKARGLPPLQAVLAGVTGMEEWANSQGIPPERIQRVTDESEDVTPRRIKEAIGTLLQPGNLDQLIIYFAGHGMNVGWSEYWLLSEASDDPNAAVNLKASEERARHCGVPHVVFISDACRSAAAGIQAQGVLGSTIFGNPRSVGAEMQVDLFFATLVGDPALEIRDPAAAAQTFRAVYTEALLEALRGQHPAVTVSDASTGGNVVRPWPLKKFLARELPVRVFQATGGANPRSQQPDARIGSDPDTAWISLIPARPGGSAPASFAGPPPADAEAHSKLAVAASERSTIATRSMVARDGVPLESLLLSIPVSEFIGRNDLDIFSQQNRQFREATRFLSRPFGSLHMETRCGFKIRGARIVRCTGANPSSVFADGTGAHADVPERSACSYLLEFAGGTGALLPAIGGFLASLTFADQQLVDVAYEPAEGTPRWGVFNDQADDIRALRAAVAAATRMGTFRLEGSDAERLARRMQLAKGTDPSLALYAAHAYRDQGHRNRIAEMLRYMREDLSVCLFDIALLSGHLDANSGAAFRGEVFPFLPMLTQSWALLPAYDVRLADGLEHISRQLLPNSLWTLLNADGVRLVADVLKRGQVQ
ncbi:MAG: hypothetical protein ACKO2P_00135 [Planctomycetota bacterium]